MMVLLLYYKFRHKHYLLVQIQTMKYLFCGFENFVGKVEPVWVALESQVHQSHLQCYDVLRWHVRTIL